MNQEPNAHSHSAAASHETAPEATPLSPRKALVGAGVVLFILLVLAAVGILRRLHADTVLAQRTNDLAAPTVSLRPGPPRGRRSR